MALGLIDGWRPAREGEPPSGISPASTELARGMALWRKSPDALFKAARNYEAEIREQPDYELSFVDQSGRGLSRLSGPLRLAFDPFSVYANRANQRRKRFTIDGHGLRATPRRPGKPGIVVLGGSAAFGYSLRSDDLTFPWLLAQRLPDCDVVNDHG